MGNITLDIQTEIELLVEIEDIVDELHILKIVLRDQKKTIHQLDHIIKNACMRGAHSLPPPINKKTLESHSIRIDEMNELAEKTQKPVCLATSYYR